MTPKPRFRRRHLQQLGTIVDGTSNTILTIQLTKYSKPWTEPADLTFDEAYDLIQKEPGVVLVGSADGGIHWIPSNISREKFSRLARRADHELGGFDDLTDKN